jgi:NCS1 family nucleobase:cation symporter-1
MIQSRPQFGYVGALAPFAVVVFLFVGFNVFNTGLAAAALEGATGLNLKAGLAIVGVLAAALAIFGYDWIHTAQRWLTYVFVIVFGVYAIGVLATIDIPSGQLDPGNFEWTPFLAMFGIVASYQLSWAPYVSDYTRYLPRETTIRSTVFWTYSGSVLGGLWLMGLGALLLTPDPERDPIEAIKLAGDDIFSGFGTFVLLFSILGLITVTTLNLYGGALTLLSAADCITRVKPTRAVRIIGIVLVGLPAVIIAAFTTQDFLDNFHNFLFILLYFMIPWTAVNLVDYYFVRRGDYAVREIFNPRGLYGRWGWRGLVSYFLGFIAMIPFFSTGLYTGRAADALGGADISIFIGLPVSAISYFLLTRDLDVERERRVAAETHAELEAESLAHERPAGT